MKNRNLFALLSLIAALMISSTVQAQTVPTADAKSLFSADASMLSGLVTDNGATPLGEKLNVVQGEVILNPKSGPYAIVWMSSGGRGEVDLFGGWKNDHLDLNVGYFEDAGGTTARILQTTAKLSLTPIQLSERSKLSLYGTINALSALSSEGDSGRFFRIGADHELKLSDLVNLLQSGYLLYDSGIFRGQAGFIARYEFGASLNGDGYAVKPTLRLSIPVNVSDRKTQVVLVIKITTR